MTNHDAGLVESPFDVPEARALITRLCKLQADVSNSVLGWGYAADCFCAGDENGGGFWNKGIRDHFRNKGLSVQFIERATRLVLDTPELCAKIESEIEYDCDD
jgi:hypothetical protein